MLDIVYSKVLMKAVIHRLTEAMAILNKVDEGDYTKFVKACQKKQDYIKHIRDNAERGNIFLMLFFLRELLDVILSEDT